MPSITFQIGLFKSPKVRSSALSHSESLISDPQNDIGESATNIRFSHIRRQGSFSFRQAAPPCHNSTLSESGLLASFAVATAHATFGECVRARSVKFRVNEFEVHLTQYRLTRGVIISHNHKARRRLALFPKVGSDKRLRKRASTLPSDISFPLSKVRIWRLRRCSNRR